MKKNKPTILLDEVLEEVFSLYEKKYGLKPFIVEKDGRNKSFTKKHTANLPVVVKARAYALQEAVRWGEPYVAFLVPNVVFWVVPVERDEKILAAIVGGEVAVDRDPYSHIETVNHLVANGSSRDDATRYINSLPVWESQEQTRDAAEYLFKLFYQLSGWRPVMLERNHARQIQQRQIAEEIHSMKKGLHASSPLDEERRLLSLMKAGDTRAARGELNRALGILFSQTANLMLLRAQLVEMMGYLVRSAIEDNPAMESLVASNHRWMTCLIEADDFEELSRVVQESLDDFMGKMALHGHTRSGKTVAKILDWLGDHYHEEVTLARLGKEVGLSPFRVAHIVKAETGKTMLQHIHRLRIQEAQRLLEQSAMSCSDVAYEVGFSDQSYFIKQFRKWMGITPHRYRKMIRDCQKSK